jgi:hypothetical protein
VSGRPGVRPVFALRRALLLTLVACCVLIPVAAAVLNGFLPGLGAHAAQTGPLVVPSTPAAAAGPPAPPAIGPGYRAVPASETIFGHLGIGLTVLLLAAAALTAALGVRTLRRRRSRG